MEKNLNEIYSEIESKEKAGMEPSAIYSAMADDDRQRLFTAHIMSAAAKTAARVQEPGRVYGLVSGDMDDIFQAANLRFLEAVAAGGRDKDGNKLNFKRLISRACNGAIAHAWRELYAHPTAAERRTDESGKEYSLIDIYAGPETKRPAAPGAALIIRETIAEALQYVPAGHRATAENILKLHESGYTWRDIARRIDASEMTVNRIRAEIAEAAETYKRELQSWTGAPLAEVIDALKKLFEE